LEAASVPCGPINNMQEVFENPQVEHRGLRVDIPHPAGFAPSVASPMRFSETPVTYEVPPPLLGQHTDEVLQGLLGMSPQQIADLRARGVA
jgi:formyl-CoA transferase